MNESLTIGSN